MKDLTNKGNKITVLRGFGDRQYLVVQGNSFYGKGLNERYQEFTQYSEAVEYFNAICN